MTFNIDISPDDERILNDILDKGLYDFRKINTYSTKLISRIVPRLDPNKGFSNFDENQRNFNSNKYIKQNDDFSQIYNITKEKQILTPITQSNLNWNTKNTDFKNKIHFNQMRDEIDNLQEKIKSMEKKYRT